jgi:predicted phage terminase large subunit-like protein
MLTRDEQVELTELVGSAEARLCEMRLAEFVRSAWPLIEPRKELLWNWHIDLLCEYLESVTAGECRRLIINIPPRSIKSTLATIMWPCWEWTRKPDLRYLFVSYSSELATDHSLKRRTILESEWYQGNWPEAELSSDQNLKMHYGNIARGHMIATSITGVGTGIGGNRIIIDDPLNAKEAYSEVERSAVNRDFDTTFPSRLDDKKRDAMVVVMQRLHDEDLTGHLLARDAAKEWTHVCLPTECRQRTVLRFPRSGREIIREPGDLLWPEREGPAEIASLRILNGTRDFEAQYNQEPAPPGGALIQTGWWKFYREAPAKLDEVIQSWDMTFKGASSSDYVVGQIWGRKGSEKYLLDQVRERADFPTTVRLFRLLSAKWPAAELKLVEDAANGPAVIAELRREISGIKAVKPKGSKVARAASVSATIEAGNVYLPDETIAPWVGDFIFEASRFPFGAHDDQVDACTQALSRLTTTWSTADILAWGGIAEEETT